MRKALAVSTLSATVLCSGAIAQSRDTDFSGRWVLTASRPEPDEPDTLVVTAASELLISQTPKTIIIEHPSKPARYPAAGTFEFGSGGFVGDAVSGEGRWGVTFFGTQLMMSRSTSTLDINGSRTTAAYGSFWLIDGRGRLVIEFREERTKERPKVAMRVYVRKR